MTGNYAVRRLPFGAGWYVVDDHGRYIASHPNWADAMCDANRAVAARRRTVRHIAPVSPAPAPLARPLTDHPLRTRILTTFPAIISRIVAVSLSVYVVLFILGLIILIFSPR